LKEIITVFTSTNKTQKTPISPYNDKTFVFETFLSKSNLEMYGIMCTNFILNIPLYIDKPTRLLRQKTELEQYYPKNLTYIILDIDDVKSEFNKQVILEYFKNYKVILGESRSYDGFSNFNMKGVLFTEEIEISDLKTAVSFLAHELKSYCNIDESVTRKATLNAPILKNKVFLNNEDGIRYKFIKQDSIEKINNIKKEYIGDCLEININDLKDIKADTIEKFCLRIFQNMGYLAIKNNSNGSITFKHPSENKTPGGYFWFSSSPYTMHHFNTLKTINIYDIVRKLDSGKELLRKDIDYADKLLSFNVDSEVLRINERIIELNDPITDKIYKFLHAKNGLLSIRSPMGTGKSTIIKHVIQECHELDMKVIIITNRISVAQDFSKKYNLKLYNKDEYNRGDSLVVQYDSLWKFNIKFFDIVIMDEFISLMMHSRNNLNNNSTNIGKFFGCFNKKLVIADAFLTGYENFLLNKETNIHLIDNDYRDDTHLFNYENQNYFIENLLYHSKKHKITVSSTSLSFINSLYKLLSNQGLKVITLTADTPDTTKQLIYELFEQCEHDKWDVLIYSPTLTVGVSNMNNNYYHFHYDTSSSTDVIGSLQMIKRTRKAKEIHMYIKDKINYLKTNYNDIRDEYVNNQGNYIENNYLFNKDEYGESILSETGKKALKIDTFKNILEYNHKKAFLWLCKYHFLNEPVNIDHKFESNILSKYQKQVKDEKITNIQNSIEQFFLLSDIDKSNIILEKDSDKTLKYIAELEENIEASKEIKIEILNICALDNYFIKKCKYYKITKQYTDKLINLSDIKRLISNNIMKNNQDEIKFYNSLLEYGQKEIQDKYLLNSIDKKLKIILDDIGYYFESSNNFNTTGLRTYSINENVKKYYQYIK
jgi:hypothetical protein